MVAMERKSDLIKMGGRESERVSERRDVVVREKNWGGWEDGKASISPTGLGDGHGAKKVQ